MENHKRGLLYFGSFCFAAFLIFFPSFATASTIVQYEPSGDGIYRLATQSLTKDKSPYVLTGGCSGNMIPAWSTVTIEAGVVVKFQPVCGGASTQLVVNGNLIVKGSTSEPVIFTSWKDDSAGGDTNSDDFASLPRPGDWQGIKVNSGSSNLDHAIIRYGGAGYYYGELFINGGNISLTNLEMASSSSSGLYTWVPLTINRSSFHDNAVAAIDTSWVTNPLAIAVNNWWGDDSGPKVPANPGGKGQPFFGNVLYDPWIGKVTNQRPKLVFDESVFPQRTFLPVQPIFEISYSDADNDRPVGIDVVINSSTYPMSEMTSSTDYLNGVVYSFNPPTGTLQKGVYNYYFEASDGKATTTLYIGSTFEVKNTPVILIPGIAGSELNYGDENIWMNLWKMLTDPGDEFLDLLSLNTGQEFSGGISVGDIIREKNYLVGTVRIFGPLINEFLNKDYKEDIDLFVFPYDWRLDNRLNSQKLKEKIDSVLSKMGSQQVDLVAHSMGGLVAKQYIIDNGGQNIDKLVFLGTPHLGSPDSLKTLIAGDNFKIPFLNPLEIKKLAQNMSSVYELLPSKKYVNEFGGYLINFGSAPLGYVDTNSFLVDQGLNKLLIEDAGQFHGDPLDNFNASGVHIINIVGCDAATNGLIIRKNAGYKDGMVLVDYDVRKVVGDGTVPLNSALAVPSTQRYYVTGVEHSKMPSQDGIRQLVADIISGAVISSSSLPKNIRMDTEKCFLEGKLLSMHSPVNLQVYDEAGNHVGPTADGVVDENIPGGTYDDIGGDKFIFLPNDQKYSVRLEAFATGTFSFSIADIGNSVVKKMTNYSDVHITPLSQGQMEITPLSKDNFLNFDKDGSGTFAELPADSVLNSVESVDLNPPISNISFIGAKSPKGWFVSSVTTTISTEDDNSGILTTEYSLDGGSSWQKYSEPFVVSAQGTSTIHYKSIDRAGNKESEKLAVIHIDSVAPEAEISFDLSKRDIVVTGLDDQSFVSVEDLGDKIILTDEADNKTILYFKEKDRRRLLSARFLSISYNGVEFNKIIKNQFAFTWSYDKNNRLTGFSQSISVKNVFRLFADYDPKRDVTIIKGMDVDLGRIKNRINGLTKIIYSTKQGEFKYSFKYE